MKFKGKVRRSQTQEAWGGQIIARKSCHIRASGDRLPARSSTKVPQADMTLYSQVNKMLSWAILEIQIHRINTLVIPTYRPFATNTKGRRFYNANFQHLPFLKPHHFRDSFSFAMHIIYVFICNVSILVSHMYILTPLTGT